MAPRNYRAFMLRFWRETDDGIWRASLEDPHSGERISFAGAEHLLAYLAEQLEVAGKSVMDGEAES